MMNLYILYFQFCFVTTNQYFCIEASQMRYYKLPKRLFFTMDPISSSFLTNCLYIFFVWNSILLYYFLFTFCFCDILKQRKEKEERLLLKQREGQLDCDNAWKNVQNRAPFVLHLQYIYIIRRHDYCWYLLLPQESGKGKGKIAKGKRKNCEGKAWLFMHVDLLLLLIRTVYIYLRFLLGC